MAASGLNQVFSFNVANSVGGPNKAPILIPEEYNQWATRMQDHIEGKGPDYWRSVVEGPHVPTLNQLPLTEAERALGGHIRYGPLTAADQEKIKVDKLAKTELNYGIPPDSWDVVSGCSSAKEIWDTLKNLYDGDDKARDKKQMAANKEYSAFRAAPGESLLSAFKRFKAIVTKVKASGGSKSNLEANVHFIEGLGENWDTVMMIVSGQGNLRNMTLHDLYNDLISHELTVLRRVERNGGPLALYTQNPTPEDNNLKHQFRYQKTALSPIPRSRLLRTMTRRQLIITSWHSSLRSSTVLQQGSKRSPIRSIPDPPNRNPISRNTKRRIILLPPIKGMGRG